MSQVTLKGNPITLSGELPALGTQAPSLQLVAKDLSEKTLADFSGKKILNIVPSLDTATCATSTRKFNEEAAGLEGVEVLVISADLPFAQTRFCSVEGIEKVTALSSFRSSFAQDYGIQIQDGPLQGLTSRSVVVLNENNEVVYSELVGEIADEPNYAAALEAAKA